MFGYEDGLTFPIYVSDQKFKNSMNLLLLLDGDKSHYVYIKDFNRFISTKQRIKTKNTFAKVVYSIVVVKMCWQKHKEDCLSINGTQSVRLEKGTFEFNNYSPVPFKMYVDFECNLKGVEIYEGFYSKNIKVAFLLVLLTRLFLLMINLLSQ